MTKTKAAKEAHTLGPLETCLHDDGTITIERDGEDLELAVIAPNRPNALADATLYAAAPELFKALDRLQKVATRTTSGIQCFDGAELLDAAIDEARTAIAKAQEVK